MNTDCVYKKTFFLPFFAPGISRTIMTQRKIFFSSSKPNKAFFDKNLDSKDVVYDVIIPSIFPQKGWKVIFNLKILKKTNLTLLLLHIVSNDIKTKETNYYSQCLFFHEIQFVSQFPSYNNERCACLSFCLSDFKRIYYWLNFFGVHQGQTLPEIDFKISSF